LKIKIAYIIPTLNLGGAEKQQINILNCIDTQIFDVKIFVLKNEVQLISQIKNKNINIEIFNIYSINNIRELLKFFVSIIKYKPDIIHSHMYNANLLARLLKIFLPKSKIINHIHGMSKWLSFRKLFLDKFTSFLVDKFIVVSQESFDLRIKRESYSKEKLFLLMNSVNIQINRVNTNNIKKDYFNIGMASRLIAIKNIKGAIYMVKFLLDRGINVKLKIAGDGLEKDNLMNYAINLGIDKSVEFYGFINKIEEFYEEIDIYCISSFTEDMPLSVLEAMMLGKPIIASKVGGIPNLLNKFKNCSVMISDFFNDEELNKVLHFIKNLNIINCKIKLQNFAENNFSNKIYCKKLTKIYLDMIKQ